MTIHIANASRFSYLSKIELFIANIKAFVQAGSKFQSQ